MGLDSAKQFLNQLEDDHVLQSELNNVGWNINGTVEIACANGYEFNCNELQHAIDEVWGTLTEEDLLNIAGGGDSTTPPGRDPGNNSGHWEPSSGDVSGNSCFFGRN